jgi:hypothetical protein
MRDKMKKFWLLSFNLLTAIVTACQPVTQSTDKLMLKPGDEMDGMIVTTGAAKAPSLWAFCPPALENDGVVSVDCRVPPLPRLAIGHAFGLVDPALQTLDWSALTWEFYVDGRPVDLEAFGVHNYVMPDLPLHPSPVREIFRQMKAWDVVLINPTPRAHTVYGRVYAEADTYTWTVDFTVEASLAP